MESWALSDAQGAPFVFAETSGVKWLSAVEERILEAVRSAAKDGKLPCSRALCLAAELGVLPALVGSAANAAGVKIVGCQLGCFK